MKRLRVAFSSIEAIAIGVLTALAMFGLLLQLASYILSGGK